MAVYNHYRSGTCFNDQVPFKQGESYKLSKLAQFQRRLFALNQFSVVTVHPVLTGESVVPVQVTLSERKNVRLQKLVSVEVWIVDWFRYMARLIFHISI